MTRLQERQEIANSYQWKCQWLAAFHGLLIIEENYQVKLVDRLLTLKFTGISYREVYNYLKELDR